MSDDLRIRVQMELDDSRFNSEFKKKEQEITSQSQRTARKVAQAADKAGTDVGGAAKKHGKGVIQSMRKTADEAAKSIVNFAKLGVGGLVGTTTAALKFGASFESAVAKASTMFGNITPDMDALKEKMIALSDESGIAADAIGEALYDALSSGVEATEDMDKALTVVAKSAKLAKAGFTDTAVAQTATLSVMNAYGKGVEDIDNIQRILMQTQNQGKTTIGELGGVLSNVTSAAASSGVKFEAVAAAIAVMTQNGVPAAQATTQLRGTISELSKQGTHAQKSLQKAAEGTKYAGKSFRDLMKEGVPLHEVLNLMSDYATNNGLSMQDMFSSIEAGQGALSLTGENAARFVESLKGMAQESDIVEEAYQKVSNTTQEKFAKNINNLKNVFIELYEKGFKPVVNAVFDMIQWFKEHSTVAKVLGIFIGGLTAALVAYNVATVVAATGSGILSAALGILGGVVAFLTSPVTLIIAAITAFAALGVVVYENWDVILEWLKEAWQTVADFFVELWENISTFFISLWETLSGAFRAIIEAISDFFVNIWGGIRDFFVGLWEKISNWFKAKMEQNLKIFTMIWTKLRDFFVGLWESIRDFFFNIWEAIKNKTTAIWNAISGFLRSLWEGVSRIATNIFNGIRNFLAGLWDGIRNTIQSVWNSIGNILRNAWNGMKNTAQNVFTSLRDFFRGIWDSITGVFNSTIGVLLGKMGSLGEGIRGVWDSIKGIFGGIIDFIRSVFTGNWSAAWQAVTDIFSSIVSGIAAIFKWPINAIIDGINFFIRGLNRIKIPSWVPGVGGLGINISQIPRLRVGMEYVPDDDFPAFLHKGEAVLTAEQAKRWRSGMPRWNAPQPQLQGVGAAQAITVHNQMDAQVVMDGYQVGRIVLRNLDDVRGFDS